jgi:hypothetical protein
LTEIVKIPPDGGFSVAGVTDIGSTLYAVRVDPNATGRVIRKSLPFSDRWLLDGLVAELLVPWNGPTEACRLFRQSDGICVEGVPPSARLSSPKSNRGLEGDPKRDESRLGTQARDTPDGTWALVREVGDDTCVFSFDAGGRWQGLGRFSGGRLRSRVSLEWDAESIPKVMRVDNPRKHYHAVRERVSIR